MSETHTGPKRDIGDKGSIQELQRESGTSQRQPQPNENPQNRPYSSEEAVPQEFRQHHWNDTPPEETESEGVTQGHASPQKAKSGNHQEGGSSTGLPQGEDSRNPSSDHNPRTKAAHGGDAHARDVTSQSHTGSTSDRRG
jgi:hypothetical protein